MFPVVQQLCSSLWGGRLHLRVLGKNSLSWALLMMQVVFRLYFSDMCSQEFKTWTTSSQLMHRPSIFCFLFFSWSLLWALLISLCWRWDCCLLHQVASVWTSSPVGVFISRLHTKRSPRHRWNEGPPVSHGAITHSKLAFPIQIFWRVMTTAPTLDVYFFHQRSLFLKSASSQEGRAVHSQHSLTRRCRSGPIG